MSDCDEGDRVTAYDRVVAKFGRRPEVAVHSPAEYSVSVSGWHMHSGAATSCPFAGGRSLEGACKRLLDLIAEPQVMLVEGEHCDHVCHAKYMKSEPHQRASRAAFRSVIEDAARTVDSWPAWKRGLPPCEDERCEREAGHKGKHRAARPVTYDEW